ncbi:MAG TPA: DUF4135 domain-containing protein [Bacteroidia bacterium]|nr:DUF4135 domain-containing protein [Bacteroidia bacterium]
MTRQQLIQRLNQIGVVPPDVNRAALYMDYLEATRTYFFTTLAANNPVGMGNDYEFVRRAVQSPALLKTLAEMLDFFVGTGVDNQMTAAMQIHHNWTYNDFFTNSFFDPNDIVFDNNVLGFFNRYRTARNAMMRLTANFQSNIREACERILQDRALLNRLFRGNHAAIRIDYLRGIKSTGSDFHKGGKQVLIITSRITIDPNDFIPATGELKFIYKPGDMEIDCLVTGNSAAANFADPNFPLSPTLAEIINTRIRAIKQVNPNSPLELIPTYRILPRNYHSAVMAGPPFPNLRNAYGYVEFLSFGFHQPLDFFGDPNGQPESDYLITPGMNRAEIVRRFYRIMGQWCALSATFSLADLHYENVRVRGYYPFLIDLEDSLIDPVNNIENDTLLLTTSGGITGVHKNNWDYDWEVAHPDTPGGAFIQRHYIDKYCQNRLWERQGQAMKTVVPVDAAALREGFDEGMQLIAWGVGNLQNDINNVNTVNNSIFTTWIARTNRVLVRFLAYSTGDLRGIRDAIYLTPNVNTPVAQVIAVELLAKLTNQYNQYQQQNTPDPNFVACRPTIMQNDCQNMDIPTFYHRLHSNELVDSSGNNIDVPAQVTITDPLNPAQTIPANTNMARNHFFAQVPMTTRVLNTQLDILAAQNTYLARFNLIDGQIQATANANDHLPPPQLLNFMHT